MNLLLLQARDVGGLSIDVYTVKGLQNVYITIVGLSKITGACCCLFILLPSPSFLGSIHVFAVSHPN